MKTVRMKNLLRPTSDTFNKNAKKIDDNLNRISVNLLLFWLNLQLDLFEALLE